MKEQVLGYGTTGLAISFDPSKHEFVESPRAKRPLSDAEVGERLDAPVGGQALEEMASEGGTVLIVVPDATRRSAAGQIVNLVVRRLIASGTMPYDIAAIIATGIHRQATRAEKEEILTPFVTQRLKVFDHMPRDLMRITRLGETASGIPVELNRTLTEFDHVITVGAVSFHYFAGFTGGRKLICPGLASSRTIAETHRLAFDFENLKRAEGVGIGMTDGNPVHEAFIEAASFAPPSFAVNTLVDDRGRAQEVICGDWQISHAKACEAFSADHIVTIPEKRPVVTVSCGGHPGDINLIQAHKALEAASYACEEGGTIILIAECDEGLGRPDFLEWFALGSSMGIAEELARSYKVNGQTAWSLKKKAERFDVRIMTELPEEQVSPTGMRKTGKREAEDILRGSERGWVIPYGASVLPVADK